ncbi:protein phosphatase 1 regulatory subunit 12A-like [Mercenaria mercenaria]|uniref:protein phosphatase 1 regulatory subunit 12A-like n=1 Tax=Mercenaria mercenaria TaxID=6596 RepID=UPI00234EF87E|nr:protein phosphatase 1 regulatory subunit 12A-like [Mercenaria mercenaria]XP_053403631.1 protein phosphatase 1 regulatory subunit 12A-like [Mercenaria mercenaria]XP_053403636.1 protein phosphatase 1 regulatory subunit 12A-like [Mercenaria mercenaria]XP_053403639.1 protein phosphatase 1 regulatory subunit 12A-like [Mercenaria mercenaria]XP_053403645.1 protein phosphatase 1 regulatory subunit 12A-like [Mercenaria mercenaria]XP_053403653.1 protein phosphatase 1 regulatory subunit 12A-like [Merc
MQAIAVVKNNEEAQEETNNSDEEEVFPKMTSSNSAKRISFPVDSILNAVIQDGDVMELLHILRYRSSEFDLNQRNHTGLTALHYAVLTNNLDSVKLLLNHGANVSSQDEYGFSPLHTAAALGFLQVTTLLIIHGADVFSLTNHSELPIDLAKDISVIRILSSEMCLKLHSEQYVKSLIFLSVRKIYAMFCNFIIHIFKGIIFIVTFVYQKCCELRTRSASQSTLIIPRDDTKCNPSAKSSKLDIQENVHECGSKKCN